MPGGSLSFSTRHVDRTVCIRNGGGAALPLEELDTLRFEEQVLKLMAAMAPGAPGGSRTGARLPAGLVADTDVAAAHAEHLREEFLSEVELGAAHPVTRRRARHCSTTCQMARFCA